MPQSDTEELCRPDDIPPVDLRSRPGYTQFRVVALDGSAERVTGLKASDFVVRAGDRELPIAYFHENDSSNSPVSLVVVADESKTMYSKLIADSKSVMKTRATINATLRGFNGCDEAAIVTTGGENSNPRGPRLGSSTLLQPFTTDTSLVLLKVYEITPAGAGLLSEGIRTALATLNDAHYADRAMVVLTDGLNREEVDKSVGLLQDARGSHISLWVIGIGDPDSSSDKGRVDRAAIERLARAGEGRALYAGAVQGDEGASLANTISTIGKSLGRGYSVGVVLPEGAAKPSIALKGHPDVIVRQSVVSPQVLTAEAALAEPAPAPKCDAGPKSTLIGSQPGVTELEATVSGPDVALSGIKESDFAASCGGMPCKIVFFAPASAEPRMVFFVVDSSGSMQSKLEAVRQGLDWMLGRLQVCDPVALLAFSAKPYLLQSPTTDHISLRNRLDYLHAFGQSSMYDALQAAVEVIKRQELPADIVLVSDGMDNTSDVSEADIQRSLANAHVRVFTIGIGNPNANSQDPGLRIGPFLVGTAGAEALSAPTLRKLATSTGGQVFIVSMAEGDPVAQFRSAAKQILMLLKSGYIVGVAAPQGDTLPTLSLPGHPDLLVHTRAIN